VNHPIPAEALKESVAIVGRTGSGKSYAAKGAIEITARPAKGDCEIRWRVVDESRQKTEATS
jgi:ABC-type glutathione transport system ATPase component